MIAYHAVTDRPLLPGQQIVFDETHRSGVYLRVHEKRNLIRDIYSNPEKYRAHPLGHHTAVALRELALEEVRARKYPQYPSRMACLYASATLEEAERWADFFAKIGRPTYSIVRLDCRGPFFSGDATKCFEGLVDHRENLRLAELYWENPATTASVRELLLAGPIRVLEIVREINRNLPY